jgi:hypothetical protein
MHMPASSDTGRLARSYEPLEPESGTWKALHRFGFTTLFISLGLMGIATALYFRT